MAVITVSRQYAAGGSQIAARVAARLGWELIDNTFVARVAAQVGLAPEEVEAREERVPGLAERLARAIATSSPEVFVPAGEIADEDQTRLVRVTERVITEAVQHGNAVIVGRGAHAYLADREQALHVFIVAPRQARIETAVTQHGLSRKDAERCVVRVDDQRRRYVKTHYDGQWDDPASYDLVVNSAELGYDGCAALVVEAARGKRLVSG